jgi:hypothetical protein
MSMCSVSDTDMIVTVEPAVFSDARGRTVSAPRPLRSASLPADQGTSVSYRKVHIFVEFQRVFLEL